jgi:isopenicillin N synthase-like dioxygenase
MTALAPDALVPVLDLANTPVPVLDLANTPQEALVAQLRQVRPARSCLTPHALKPRAQACEQVGFFYVINGGVEPALMEEAFKASAALFELPAEVKRALLATPANNNRGWTPLGEETLDPARQSRGDTKEGYYIGREVAADSPEAALPLHGPNVWPPEALLPGWRDTMERYAAACRALGMRLTRLLALALGLAPGFFNERFDAPQFFLRLLRYSAETSAPAEGVFGAGAHSDYGMLTRACPRHCYRTLLACGGGSWVTTNKPQPSET